MAEVRGPHITPLIGDADFERGCLKPLSYSPESISEAVMRYVERYNDDEGQLLPRQKKVLEQMRIYGTWNMGNIGEGKGMADLKKWFGFFDDAFFGGLLSRHCTLDLLGQKSLEHRRPEYHGIAAAITTTEIPSQERDPRFPRASPHCTITIWDGWCDDMGGDETVEHVLQALLHEMMHAVFRIY